MSIILDIGLCYLNYHIKKCFRTDGENMGYSLYF